MGQRATAKVGEPIATKKILLTVKQVERVRSLHPTRTPDKPGKMDDYVIVDILIEAKAKCSLEFKVRDDDGQDAQTDMGRTCTLEVGDKVRGKMVFLTDAESTGLVLMVEPSFNIVHVKPIRVALDGQLTSTPEGTQGPALEKAGKAIEKGTAELKAKTGAVDKDQAGQASQDQQVPPDVIRAVTERAAKEYPDNYVMQKFVRKTQIEAYRVIKTLQDPGIPADVLARILSKAIDDYPDNYVMQKFVIETQIKAYHDTH